MATVNELITALGFELKPDAKEKVKEFQGMIDGIVASGKEIGQNVKKIYADTKDASTRAKTTKEWANAIGMTTDELQKWGAAAVKSGYSAEKLYADLLKLKEQGFTMPEIYDMANKLKYANQYEKMTFANELGFDKEALAFWQQGSRQIKEALKNANIISEELLENGKEFEITTNRIEHSWSTIKDKIYLSVAKLAQKPAKKLAEYMEKPEGESTAAGIMGAVGLTSLIGSFKILPQTIKAIKSAKGLLPFLTKAGAAVKTGAGVSTAVAETGALTGTAVKTATTATEAAKVGGLVASKAALGTAALAAIVYKAIYDESKFLYKAGTKGFQNAMYDTLENGEWYNLMHWAFKGADAFTDLIVPPTENARKPVVVQGGNKTINVYPQTPMETREILQDEDLQAADPGANAPLFE